MLLYNTVTISIYMYIHVQSYTVGCLRLKLLQEVMELVAILLFTSVLALSPPPASAQSGELVLLNNYNYNDNGTVTNYSDIELICIIEDLQSNNWHFPDGPDFQLNGTDIEKEINVTNNKHINLVNFTLTPEKEGFFTCSPNGSLSNTSIGLAG